MKSCLSVYKEEILMDETVLKLTEDLKKSIYKVYKDMKDNENPTQEDINGHVSELSNDQYTLSVIIQTLKQIKIK